MIVSSSAHSHCGHYFKHLLRSLLAFAKKYSTLKVHSGRSFNIHSGGFSIFRAIFLVIFSCFFMNDVFKKNRIFCGWKNNLKLFNLTNWINWCENFLNPEFFVLFHTIAVGYFFHLSTVIKALVSSVVVKISLSCCLINWWICEKNFTENVNWLSWIL